LNKRYEINVPLLSHSNEDFSEINPV
jgi:hypothetical protein